MPKISDKELVKVLVRLWKQDYVAIQRMATTEVTAAEIIRDAISHFVRAAKDRADRTIDAQMREEKQPSPEFLGALHALRKQSEGPY